MAVSQKVARSWASAGASSTSRGNRVARLQNSRYTAHGAYRTGNRGLVVGTHNYTVWSPIRHGGTGVQGEVDRRTGFRGRLDRRTGGQGEVREEDRSGGRGETGGREGRGGR